VLLNLSTPPGSGAVSDIDVVAKGRFFRSTQHLNELNPGQTAVLQFYIPLSAIDAYAETAYLAQGVRSVFVISLSPNEISSGASGSGQLWTPVIGFLGILLGAALAHFAARARERDKAKFDWNKMLYDKHAAAYTQFLHSWGGVANLPLLKAHFEALSRETPLRRDVRDAYLRTISIMESAAGHEKVSEACRNFYEKVERDLRIPSL